MNVEMKMDLMLEKMERLEPLIGKVEKLEPLIGKVDNLVKKVESLDKRMETVEGRLSSVEVTLENVTNPNIKMIAQGHSDLGRKLDEALKITNDRELLSVRVNILEDEVRKLKAAN